MNENNTLSNMIGQPEVVRYFTNEELTKRVNFLENILDNLIKHLNLEIIPEQTTYGLSLKIHNKICNQPIKTP